MNYIKAYGHIGYSQPCEPAGFVSPNLGLCRLHSSWESREATMTEQRPQLVPDWSDEEISRTEVADVVCGQRRARATPLKQIS